MHPLIILAYTPRRFDRTRTRVITRETRRGTGHPVSWTSEEKYSSLVPPTTTKTRVYAGYEFEPTCFALWFMAGMIGLWNASERFEVINFRIFLVLYLAILKCWKKILQFLLIRIRINAIFKLSKNSPPRDPRDVDLKLGNYLDIRLSRIHFAPFRSLLVADRSCFAKPVSVNADSFMAALCHPGNAFG